MDTRGVGRLRWLAAVAACSLMLPAFAGEEEWNQLQQEAARQFQQRQYPQAEVSARAAMREAELTFGSAHLSTANSLNILGLILTGQGRYAEAEEVLRRAVSIFARNADPEGADYATIESNLADAYKQRGAYREAEPLYRHALAVFEKRLGPEHPNVAQILVNLAGVPYALGRYAEAEALSQRALAIQEKAFGSDHPVIATSLNNLAFLQATQGRYAAAEPLYRRSLAIQQKHYGVDNPQVAYILGNLGELYAVRGDYVRALPLMQRALELREKGFGREHPEVAIGLVNLAGLYRLQGQYERAGPMYQRALTLVERSLGAEHPYVASVVNQMAILEYALGRFDRVETLFKRAIAIQEKVLGLDHPDLAVTLNNLAAVYTTQGQYEKAAALRTRSLAILEKAFGTDHPKVAEDLHHIAYQYSLQKQYAEAEQYYRRALEIRERLLGPTHPEVGVALYDLATTYGKLERYDEAVQLFQRALRIAEQNFGPEHENVATSLYREAELHKAHGAYAQAEPLYQRALAIAEKLVSPDHPGIALGLNGLAELYLLQGRDAEGLALARRASAIARKRIVAGGEGGALRETYTHRSGFQTHLQLLARNPDHQPAAEIADEALQIAQLAQASGTAAAIGKMAARFAVGNDALAGLVKRKQDAIDRRARDEALLVQASTKAPAERVAEIEVGWREDIVRMDAEIARANAELSERYPEYQELTRNEPIEAARIQALLRPGEAMLVYELGDSGYLWVIRPDSATFLPLDAAVGGLSGEVAGLRAQMEFDETGSSRPLDVGLLHTLYRSLFAPALPHLAGVRHLLVVPAGPLQSLPFGVLVASPPQAVRQAADYRGIDWLARHYAVSVLPAVSSLQAFRQFAGSGQAARPFAGFGDPLIGESGAAPTGKRVGVDVAGLFRNLAVNRDPAFPMAERADAAVDIEAIRRAPRLPETADELQAMARVLGADADALWLREAATESRVKRLDLSNYRILAFATHGVMAGEVAGAGEPGLILTPPAQASAEDDGYLAASEIARLKLDADWVVLSACNTAAADGTPGAEGLSGLGKAFFYAGARSLLVSHWPVASAATVPLSTGMLREYEAAPAAGKAEALRKSMMTLMNTPEHPEYAHPVYWAPFVVVGEGGSSGDKPVAPQAARAMTQ